MSGTIVSINRGKTKEQIESLSNVDDGKIFFATDGGIYISQDGTVTKKADVYDEEMEATAGILYGINERLNALETDVCIGTLSSDVMDGEDHETTLPLVGNQITAFQNPTTNCYLRVELDSEIGSEYRFYLKPVQTYANKIAIRSFEGIGYLTYSVAAAYIEGSGMIINIMYNTAISDDEISKICV